jgi:starch-binding outer membrane protein, SusD/RagB family
MKIQQYIYMALCAIMLNGAVGCKEYLEQEPLSEGTVPIFYKTPEQFKYAANAFYDDVVAWKDLGGGASYYLMDQGTDISGLGSNGGGIAAQSDVNWNNPYTNIRQYNMLLAKSEEYAGNKEDIKKYVGAAKFFRAWQYFYMVKRFGGVPIVTYEFGLDDPLLYAPRNSRYEVIAQVIADLNSAIADLPKETAIAAADKGQISKEAAMAFLARVTLYEATWEKYVTTASVGMDLDGDGVTVGAGKAKPAGYPSVEDMFTMAKQNSGAVIDEAAAGTFELWNQCDSLSYYYLFNLDDDGKSNFKGVGKSTNKEFIFKTKYDFVKKRPAINISHTWPVNISAQLGESFLCRNGLPIRISTSPNMADAQNNPQFLGYSKFASEFRNRDYRFISSTVPPDRLIWGRGVNVEGGGNTDLTPYPDPVKWAAKKIYIANPLLRGGNFSNYGSRKFRTESPNREDNQESYDYSQIRLAEVYLTYAEATCELNGGTISDGDLDKSINKLRARARVANLTNALIANVYDAGWWDHKLNKTVVKKMNMLDEIRRERACELFGEGFRMDDLKRWGIAQYNLTGQKLGRRLYGSEYMTAVDNNPNTNAAEKGKPSYWPEKYPLAYGIFDESKGANPTDPDYGRAVTNLASGLKFAVKDYLTAIPLNQIQLNGNLKQNPGW